MGDYTFHQQLPGTVNRTESTLHKTTPSRSSTDPSERKERSHLHRRLHANSLRSKGLHSSGHHNYRHQAKDTIQSAIELKPPISFDHLLRRDKKSPDSSRRGSTNPQGNDWSLNEQQQKAEAEKEARKRVKREDVQKAKALNAKREEELRESLKSVEELGMSSTRQLDDTYYSILEKASILRSTVASLQQLADESRRMHTTFQEQATEMERDTIQNLDGFGNLEQQEKTVNTLVDRLKDSKMKTDKLNERLESARHRVEAYQRRYNDQQSKRRKQWHITWGTLAGIVVLIVAIIIAKNHRRVGMQLDGVGKTLAGIGDTIDDIASPIITMLKPSPSEDPVLDDMFGYVIK